jgi:hypothetical protein
MLSRTRRVRVLLASALIALVPSAEALAHGDPTTHYLETGSLYPSFAARPSQARELALMGLLQAAAERGYPVKVSLVGSIDDLVDAPGMFKAPQRYAEAIGSALGGHTLRAPIVVVSPNGIGISGMQLRGKALRPVSRAEARAFVRGIDVPRAEGDAMAAAASRVLRRLARSAGRPLPAHVAPLALPTPAARSERRLVAYRSDVAGNSAGWAVFAVLGLVFTFAALAQRVRRKQAM